MPLTPDDVVTKQFQHVRFKEGFDPDEVDDFLDEIVVEWRKTIAENEELKAKVASLEEQLANQAAAPVAHSAPEPAPVPVPAAVPVVESAPLTLGAAQTAGILELAQRLHDEHIAEGEAKRNQILAEARAHAASLISEAENRGRDEIARLDRERAALEARISELRQFERDYRTQLRSYI